jgi:hypothetical protein
MRHLHLDRLDRIYPQAHFDLALGCAEPGYEDQPVLLADWNHVPQRVSDALESLGFLCEWVDEWATCSECGKAIRTNPDSYNWQPAYWLTECEIFCLECLSPKDYYTGLENNPSRAATTTIAFEYPPEDYGYKLVADNYESGFYGCNDNPPTILAAAQAERPGRYIFVMTDQGQFSIDFALYRRKD